VRRHGGARREKLAERSMPGKPNLKWREDIGMGV